MYEGKLLLDTSEAWDLADSLQWPNHCRMCPGLREPHLDEKETAALH